MLLTQMTLAVVYSRGDLPCLTQPREESVMPATGLGNASPGLVLSRSALADSAMVGKARGLPGNTGTCVQRGDAAPSTYSPRSPSASCSCTTLVRVQEVLDSARSRERATSPVGK